VLLSNLGLTVFVRHLVNLVKQVPIVFSPQGRRELSDRDLSGLLHFCALPPPQQKTIPSDIPSLFIESYVSYDIQGDKSLLLKSPSPMDIRALPLAM
jgi:hypothetical protein